MLLFKQTMTKKLVKSERNKTAILNLVFIQRFKVSLLFYNVSSIQFNSVENLYMDI